MIRRERCVKSKGHGEKLWDSLANERGNVSRALRHGDDFNKAFLNAIDDRICANGPEQNRKACEVVAAMAHTRVPGECLELLKELRDPTVGASMSSCAMNSQIVYRSDSASALSTYSLMR